MSRGGEPDGRLVTAPHRPDGRLGPHTAPTPAERFAAMLPPTSLGSPLPASVLPLARELAPGHRPRLVTGSSSRAALGAAGARAATVGDRIHLPYRPEASGRDLGTLAHELTHVAERSATPRFLLKRVSGHLDAGERQARKVGSAVESAAARARGGAERLRASARSQGSAVEDRVSGVADRGRSLVEDVGERARELTSAGPALADRVRSSPSAPAARERVAERLSPVTSGTMPLGPATAVAARGAEGRDLVDRGASATADAGARGRRVVDRSVQEGRSRASDRRERLVRALGKTESRVDETVQNVRAVGAEAAGRPSSVAAASRATAKDAVAAGGAVATSAADRAREGVDRIRRGVGGSVDTARDPLEALRDTDGVLDRLLERLEERVLEELQRRGGRYEGMF